MVSHSDPSPPGWSVAPYVLHTRHPYCPTSGGGDGVRELVLQVSGGSLSKDARLPESVGLCSEMSGSLNLVPLY